MKYTVIFVSMIIGIVIIVSLGILVDNKNTISPSPLKPIPIIHIDESMKTGFLSSEDFMARFETIEFPVAGLEETQTVCRIDVYRWPDIDHPVEYITDSFDEAVEFLYLIGGVEK